MPTMSKYPTLKDGEAFFIKRGKEILKFSCCDCSMVHFMDIHLNRNGYFKVQMFQDRRATGALRRHRYGTLQRKVVRSWKMVRI